MARQMNPEKPGVMIYFRQIRGLTKRMTDTQQARLLRGILDYAELGEQTDFGDDPLLDTAFYGSIAFSVDRDDERFTETSANRKYSNYARWSEKNNAYVVTREEFKAAGCPPFGEIKKRLVQMDSSGTKWNQMDFFYSIWNTITEPTSTSNTNSFSLPVSVSASEADRSEEDAPENGPGSDEEEEQAKPYEIPTLEEVEDYCRRRELKYVDPEYYYHYHCANRWTYGKSRERVRDWKAHIRAWDAGDRKRGNGESDFWKEERGDSETRKYAQELQQRRAKKSENV